LINKNSLKRRAEMNKIILSNGTGSPLETIQTTYHRVYTLYDEPKRIGWGNTPADQHPWIQTLEIATNLAQGATGEYSLKSKLLEGIYNSSWRFVNNNIYFLNQLIWHIKYSPAGKEYTSKDYKKYVYLAKYPPIAETISKINTSFFLKNFIENLQGPLLNGDTADCKAYNSFYMVLIKHIGGTIYGVWQHDIRCVYYFWCLLENLTANCVNFVNICHPQYPDYCVSVCEFKNPPPNCELYIEYTPEGYSYHVESPMPLQLKCVWPSGKEHPINYEDPHGEGIFRVHFTTTENRPYIPGINNYWETITMISTDGEASYCSLTSYDYVFGYGNYINLMYVNPPSNIIEIYWYLRTITESEER